jgi:hypothetical protein
MPQSDTSSSIQDYPVEYDLIRPERMDIGEEDGHNITELARRLSTTQPSKRHSGSSFTSRPISGISTFTRWREIVPVRGGLTPTISVESLSTEDARPISMVSYPARRRESYNVPIRGGLTPTISDESLASEASHETVTAPVKVHEDDFKDLPDPFIGKEDARLSPGSGSFDVKTWVRAVLNVQDRDPERYPRRTAGVSFRNLSAYGFGSSTDYQKDVGNVWLDTGGLARKLLGREKKHRIDILRNFDGLVKSGETLVVLGRPGSGCTTFLKTSV